MGKLPLHRFSDPRLALQALTHSSFGVRHNERLEWLGDCLLEFFISCRLYRRHPDLSEGVLSQARAYLVNGDSLSDVARAIALPSYLRVGKSSPAARDSNNVLAGALEAYLAAIFLDSDYSTAAAAAEMLFSDKLSRLEEMLLDDPDSLKDGKTRLQEMLQAKKMPLPLYKVEKTAGPAHDLRFTVHCEIEGEVVAVAVAGSRREAERRAGDMALKKLSAAR